MKVEYSENGRRPKNGKRRISKIKVAMLLTLILLVIVGIAVTLMLTVLFNLNTVKIIGRSIYSEQEIIDASGVTVGDNLIRMSSDEIAENITKSLPYVKKVNVVKSLPDALGIEVTPASESMVFETEDGMYIADSDFKILRSTVERPGGLLRVKGIKSSEFIIGKAVDFSDKHQRDVLNDIVGLCNAKGFDLILVDVDNLVDIKFVINEKLYIKLGSYTEMGGKFNHLETMLKSVEKDVSASISLVDWSVNNKKAVLKYEDITEFLK